MSASGRVPQRVAVAANPQMLEAAELSRQLVQALQEQGLEVLAGELNDERLREQVRARRADLLVALGGDGTMLRAGHLCAPLEIPILGVNLGRFGFLIEIQREDWREALERVLQGHYWVERRMMLRAEHKRQERALGGWEVLNECVIGRGETVRPVRLTTEVDGRYLTTYVADALIAATPTGSTAYALAAGGPILPPELRNILLMPVAPHLSVDRAVVLHEGSWVRVVVHSDHQAILSADGQPPVRLQDGDCVEVHAAQHAALFARLQDPGYFYRNLTSRMNQNPSVGAAEGAPGDEMGAGAREPVRR
jgi:NAD+ kinase